MEGYNHITEENINRIKEEVKLDIARSLIDTLAVQLIAEKLNLDISKVQDIRRDYEQIEYINKIKQNTKKEVAKSLVDCLAVPIIAVKVGVKEETVIKYR